MWRLTARELLELAEGQRWRERQALEQLAWQTAYLLRAWGNPNITPKDLLADPPGPEESEAQLSTLLGEPGVHPLEAAIRAKVSRN